MRSAAATKARRSAACQSVSPARAAARSEACAPATAGSSAARPAHAPASVATMTSPIASTTTGRPCPGSRSEAVIEDIDNDDSRGGANVGGGEWGAGAP